MDLDFNQGQGAPQGSTPPNPSNPIPAPAPMPKPEPMPTPAPQEPKPSIPAPSQPPVVPPMPPLDPKPLMTEPPKAMMNAKADKIKPGKKTSGGHSAARWIMIVALILVILILGVGGWMMYNAQNTGSVSDNTTDITTTNDATGTLDTTLTDPTTTTTTDVTTSTTDTTTPAGRDSERKADLANIKAYLEEYYNQNGSYPVVSAVNKINNSDSVLYTALVPKYTNELPSDPLDPDYWYGYRPNGSSYELTSRLEDTADPAGSMDGSVFIYRVALDH